MSYSSVVKEKYFFQHHHLTPQIPTQQISREIKTVVCLSVYPLLGNADLKCFWKIIPETWSQRIYWGNWLRILFYQ